VLDNALREAIGQYRCEQLNNTCQYVQNANQAVSGKVKEVNTGQTLAQAQDAIARTLQADLTDTLGGRYFEGIKFRLRGVSFAPEVQAQITRAQATRTAVATARLDAQKRVEQAIGDRQVAEQRAQGDPRHPAGLQGQPRAGAHRLAQGAAARAAVARRRHEPPARREQPLSRRGDARDRGAARLAC
jgi:hypothetical protein